MYVLRSSTRLAASARLYTSTQTHFCSGITSHWPLNVPPQGPLRRFLGHVMGQTYSVSPKTQLPHAWHPNTGFLNASSAFSSAFEANSLLSIKRSTPVSTLFNGFGV